jgi:hypothetical protein
MKRFTAATLVLIVILCSTSAAQELNIGPTVGATMTGGGRGFAPGIRRNNTGASFTLGAEAVYSLATLPFDLVGQFSFAPGSVGFRRRDGLVTSPDGRGGPGGDGGSFFSAGLGGRWVPMDGPVAPYVGASLLLTHEQAPRERPDSALVTAQPVGDPGGNVRDFRGFGERNGGTNLGLGFSVGSAFDLSQLLRLDVGVSYSLIAPFSRGGDRSSMGFGASLLFRVL